MRVANPVERQYYYGPESTECGGARLRTGRVFDRGARAVYLHGGAYVMGGLATADATARMIADRVEAIRRMPRVGAARHPGR